MCYFIVLQQRNKHCVRNYFNGYTPFYLNRIFVSLFFGGNPCKKICSANKSFDVGVDRNISINLIKTFLFSVAEIVWEIEVDGFVAFSLFLFSSVSRFWPIHIRCFISSLCCCIVLWHHLAFSAPPEMRLTKNSFLIVSIKDVQR